MRASNDAGIPLVGEGLPICAALLQAYEQNIRTFPYRFGIDPPHCLQTNSVGNFRCPSIRHTSEQYLPFATAKSDGAARCKNSLLHFLQFLFSIFAGEVRGQPVFQAEFHASISSSPYAWSSTTRGSRAGTSRLICSSSLATRKLKPVTSFASFSYFWSSTASFFGNLKSLYVFPLYSRSETSASTFAPSTRAADQNPPNHSVAYSTHWIDARE